MKTVKPDARRSLQGQVTAATVQRKQEMNRLQQESNQAQAAAADLALRLAQLQQDLQGEASS